MASIVDLAEYRLTRQPKRREPVAPDAGVRPGPHYFCTRCETDKFRLFSSGVVHCAQCGALMRNISVAESEQGKSGSK